MKRFVVVAAAIVLLCIVGVALQWRGRTTAELHPAKAAIEPPARIIESETASPSTASIIAPDEDATPAPNVVADRPRLLEATAAPAQIRAGEKNPALQSAYKSVREYQRVFHQNPVGNNTEITRTLAGKNPRSTSFLPASAKLNERGELVDAWDQPLFFHQISATNMEVRSAGADHVMWTPDDEILH